jgi:ATP-binding cassette subfamily C protein
VRTTTPLQEGRVRTPLVLQMESAECGAAALAIILAHYGRIVPLATLRRDCGVSRDGSKISNIVKAAQAYGLVAKAFKRDLAALTHTSYPYVVHWRFSHFVVVEGYRAGRVYLNDPAWGPRTMPIEDFDRCYTGVVMTFQPGPEFRRGGTKRSVGRGVRTRLKGSSGPLAAATCAALLLVAPGLAIPALMGAFVDTVLVEGLGDWGRPLVLGMGLAAAARGVLGAFQLRILRRLQNRLAVAETSRFMWHLLRLPASYYAQRAPGEVSSRLALNDQVADVLSGRLASASIDALVMIFYAVVMWQLNRPLTFVALVFASLNFAILSWSARRRRDDNARLSLEQGKTAGVGSAGLQSLRAISPTSRTPINNATP